MKEFLEKETELIETFDKPSFMDKSKTIYYIFKINDEAYCMSYNEMSKVYIISDYNIETKDVIFFYGYFSGNKAKEFIKHRKLRTKKVVQ